MEGRFVHVLLGAGSLGLCLIAPVTDACGFEIHLVGRPGSAGVPEFEYTLLGGDERRRRRVAVESFSCPPAPSVPFELRAALAAADVVLITTSVRKHIADRVEFVHALVDACRPGAEVVFVPCENRLVEGHEELLDALPARGVHCLTTVVDRVCRRDGKFKPDEPRRVTGHEYGSWLIEAAPGAPRFVAALRQAPEVSFDTKDRVAAEHRRKRMLMNGTHFAVGLLAHAAKQVSMEAAASDPKILRVVRGLLDEFYELLEPEHRAADSRLRGQRVLQVVCTFEDDVPRVMSAFSRGSLIDFFAVFEELIADPGRRRAVGAEGPESFQAVAHALVKIIQDGDSYADQAELQQRAVRLDSDVDAAAVRAFRTACTGWMPQGWIDQSALSIDRSLRSQRARWQPSNTSPTEQVG